MSDHMAPRPGDDTDTDVQHEEIADALVEDVSIDGMCGVY
ncbi:mycofactocin precursor MftA [Nocardia sp. NPDC003482]